MAQRLDLFSLHTPRALSKDEINAARKKIKSKIGHIKLSLDQLNIEASDVIDLLQARIEIRKNEIQLLSTAADRLEEKPTRTQIEEEDLLKTKEGLACAAAEKQFFSELLPLFSWLEKNEIDDPDKADEEDPRVAQVSEFIKKSSELANDLGELDYEADQKSIIKIEFRVMLVELLATQIKLINSVLKESEDYDLECLSQFELINTLAVIAYKEIVGLESIIQNPLDPFKLDGSLQSLCAAINAYLVQSKQKIMYVLNRVCHINSLSDLPLNMNIKSCVSILETEITQLKLIFNTLSNGKQFVKTMFDYISSISGYGQQRSIFASIPQDIALLQAVAIAFRGASHLIEKNYIYDVNEQVGNAAGVRVSLA